MNSPHGWQALPKDPNLKKVLVLGSGPIVIGQAAEFDYAGTQCCRALKEEGVEVVLLNSNPATIMTDQEMADKVYVEPMEVEVLEKIVKREKPDGVIGTMGGQTGLNLLTRAEREGIWKQHGVRILGTSVKDIEKAEDRKAFRKLMNKLGQPIPKSYTITSLKQLPEVKKKLSLPIIVRPAFTLGGTGGGVARTDEELEAISLRGLKQSMIQQVLLEESVLGWKEIEYEMMRDASGNKITICNMENIDPMGIHTGESIVVAPSQTLTDEEYHRLRMAAFEIIEALQIEGGCNIQFALNPEGGLYAVIEVNPRVSRSSALASKATGYPIARVATKIALGYRLHEIQNAVTRKTKASFEPALDYVVTKVPRWPFDKFNLADRKLGTQMKSTGEVMAIGRTFEESLLKALRSLETEVLTLAHPEIVTLSTMELEEALQSPTDLRLFAIFEAFRREWLVEEVAQLTRIDPFFLHKMKEMISSEKEIKESTLKSLNKEKLKAWKKLGFSDHMVAKGLGAKEGQIRQLREKWEIFPVYKMVDTCAAEFEAVTPYFYSTYEQENESRRKKKKRALVIGAGPIRIGQGIEFDYCTVHGVLTLQKLGFEAVIINNNPETVSTDFDISDGLYFEPLLLEDVWHVIREEKPSSVLVQLGGQTAINLAPALDALKIKLAGTSARAILQAEDRKRFDQLLEKVAIGRPKGRGIRSPEEATAFAQKIGYPLLVRPSFVLGGRAMEIVYNSEELKQYLYGATQVSPDHPVLIDRYVPGKEVEVDAIGDGERVYVPQIMEHIERAGVHSGDSMAVCPPQTLSLKEQQKIVEITKKLARALKIKGFINIQFVVSQGEVLVLEVNPRCSRTLPFLSKVLGEPIVDTGVRCMMGQTLKKTTMAHPERIGIKAPVFSFAKLTNVDVYLGPEMKSTGEVMGWDKTFSRALYKAFLASEIALAGKKGVLFTLADKDKKEGLRCASYFEKKGYTIYATHGTARYFVAHGIKARKVKKISEGSHNLLDLLSSGKVAMLVNTLSSDRISEKEGMQIRRRAVELNIPCLTSLDTLNAFMKSLRLSPEKLSVSPLYTGASEVRP